VNEGNETDNKIELKRAIGCSSTMDINLKRGQQLGILLSLDDNLKLHHCVDEMGFN